MGLFLFLDITFLSCEGTTTSDDLNWLYIETEFLGVYKPLGPVVEPMLRLSTTTQHLWVFKFLF